MMFALAGKEGDDGNSSGDPPQEPVNISQESAKWSTAFQTDSALANFDADCLLHIFSKLPLSEIYKAGLTCRRLFYYYKQSCRPRYKSLVLLKGTKYDVKKFKENFDKVIVETKEGNIIEPQPIPFLIEIELPDNNRCKALKSSDLLPSNFTQHLVDIFPNLTVLKVGATFDEDNFARLIDQLNISLPQLTLLFLAPQFNDGYFSRTPNFWRSLGQLQPPALKHLILFLPGYHLNQKMTQMEPYDLPFLPRLTSFLLFSDMSHFGCRLKYENAKQIGKENAQLLANISYLNAKMQHFQHGKSDDNDAKEEEIFKDLQPLRLLQTFEHSMSRFLGLLSKMSALVELKLTLGFVEECADYAGLLAALANLQHLKTLSLDYSENMTIRYGRVRWHRSALAILPTVRTLSFAYSTKTFADVVGQFHLPYVFPKLTDFKCIFAQFDDASYPNDFDYEERDLHAPVIVREAKFKRAALKLTRGMVHFPEAVKKEIKFIFDWDHYSMEELLAILPDIDIETFDFQSILLEDEFDISFEDVFGEDISDDDFEVDYGRFHFEEGGLDENDAEEP